MGTAGVRAVSGIAAIVILVVAVLVATASAASSYYTWAGKGNNPYWSNGANWVGGHAPSGSVAKLTFPALSGGSTFSQNDVTGLTAGALSIDDKVSYEVTGNQLTLGAGGISELTPSGGASFGIFNLALPLSLAASQAWEVDGHKGFELAVSGAVTGAAPLRVNVRNGGEISMSKVEVGPITIAGDPHYPGQMAEANGSVGANALNATDGHSVTLEDVPLGGDVTTGPLISAGGLIQPGRGGSPAGSLTVKGGVTLDSASAVRFTIAGPGGTAGTDYPQLKAGGAVKLGGSQLGLSSTSRCKPLPVGQVLTLIATTGSVAGTFGNAPPGSTLLYGCSGSKLESLRIDYHPQSVTATVLGTGNASSTTKLAIKPSVGMIYERVAITATVTTSFGTPDGYVGFYIDGTQVCSQPVQSVHGSYRATCDTNFSALGERRVRATFHPLAPQQSGSSTTVSYKVVKIRTRAVLAASATAPRPGQFLTYTASISQPRDISGIELDGYVDFYDDAALVSGCKQVPLTGAARSRYAQCSTAYDAAGQHRITARFASYRAIDYFQSSRSAGLPVAVSGSPVSGTASSDGCVVTSGTPFFVGTAKHPNVTATGAVRCNGSHPGAKVRGALEIFIPYYQSPNNRSGWVIWSKAGFNGTLPASQDTLKIPPASCEPTVFKLVMTVAFTDHAHPVRIRSVSAARQFRC